MTPYTARNFAIGGPTARDGQLDRFFLAKMTFHIHIVSEKAKNWTKNGQKPSKKGVFISTSDHLSNFWRQQLLRPATFRASNSYWLAQN